MQTGSSGQEFKFKFKVVTITAILDETSLTVKQGLAKWRVGLADLRHLYVIEQEGVGLVMILSYEAGPNKLKHRRVTASPGQPGFDALIKALLARRPDIDIRDKPIPEAYALMRLSNNLKWLVPAIVGSIVLALMSLFAIPYLLHGLDSGKQVIDVTQCSTTCDVNTHNLVVRGKLLMDAAIEKETTHRRGGVSVKYYIPLVPKDYKPGDPIYMVVETSRLSPLQLKKLAALHSFRGILRNIWFEGLDSDVVDFFRQKSGLNIADQARLLDLDASPSSDLWLALLILGVSLFVLAIAFVVAYRRIGSGIRPARERG